jgi:thiol-disulfide isomerase/thioredoxin
MAANLPNSAPTLRNLVIAIAAIALTVAVFFGLRAQAAAPSLASLAKTATPYEVAQTNGKPTFLEFYADWCTSCQAMAPAMADLRQTYGTRVNFVMLNIDNDKWLPEMLEYRVDGIPHFVYFDPSYTPVATAIGEQPRPILADNLDALIAAAPLPHAQALGRTSDITTDPLSRRAIIDDPRAHGSPVVLN